MNTVTVLVKKELYAFKESRSITESVSVYKISHFTSTDRLIKTTLSPFPYKGRLQSFSVCYWAGNIVLTGGDYAKKFASAQMYLMDLQSDRWQQSSLPDLNQARS